MYASLYLDCASIRDYRLSFSYYVDRKTKKDAPVKELKHDAIIREMKEPCNGKIRIVVTII